MRLLAEMSMLTPCELYFGLMKSAADTNYLMDKRVTSRCLGPKLTKVEADTCIVLHVKYACELIFQPCTVVKCNYTDSLTILLFRTNNKEGIGRCKAAVLLLLIRW